MREALVLMVLGVVLAGCAKPDARRVQGYVEGEELRMAAGRSGRLGELSVERGDTVVAGTALFAVDAAQERAAVDEASARLAAAQARRADLNKGKRSPELDVLRAQLAQAEAQARLSASQLQRQKDLFEREAISQDRLDQAQALADRNLAQVREVKAALASGELAAREDTQRAAEQDVEAATAAVRQAEASLAEKTVVSPAAGSIEDVYYRPGEWVAAGAPVLALLPPENRRLRFFVGEQELARLRPQQTVQVSCDGCGAPFTAKLSYISASAEFTPPVIYSREQRAHLVYRVEALPEKADALRLHPGQPVDVELP